MLDRFANEDFYSLRLDHQLSGSNSVFFRYRSVVSEYLVPVLSPEFPNLNENRR